MDTVDCVVIGAGVVGLAIARSLAQQGREVIIVEREAMFGSITSSRNSEVIHAGIYYPQGSLKAKLCVEGKQRLYDYCEAFHVPHRHCGKLIVATNATQEQELQRIQQKAIANGVTDLQPLTGDEAKALEPALRSCAALFSPSTGIVDAHEFMLSLLGQAEAAGALISYMTEIDRLVPDEHGIALFAKDFDEPVVHARCVINAAGLDAPALAGATTGLTEEHRPQAYLAKGNYFSLTGKAPFSHLIYPVPEQGGLGVHLTLDLGGQARFGPDVEWVDEIDYVVNPARGDQFYDVIRDYWPALKDDSLVPGYSGMRPKISPQGAAAADFRIDGPDTHGVPGLINLFGIESPGLTASLAIAQHVADLTDQHCPR